MRLVVLTSHNPRHYYVANQLSSVADETMVVSSAMGLNPALKGHHGDPDDLMVNYFNERFYNEIKVFKDRSFNLKKGQVIVVGAEEINSKYVGDQVKSFNPDVIVAFGVNILKGQILSITNKIYNMHLGMSPYYNGSYTNFWPMYNNEFEYVGITIHHLDKGIDTGNIICQSRAIIDELDTPHSIGNKTIILATRLMKRIIEILRNKEIKGVKQWKVNRPIYKMKNYNNKVALNFIKKINEGSISKWVNNGIKQKFKMVKLLDNQPVITNSYDLEPEIISLNNG